MDRRPLVSLCIPTNGVIEWVFPVLESIYSQKVDNSLFEVVISDNGNNEDFQKKILEYKETHSNLIYEKTNAPLFLSEPETYKLANGYFIKFINHRTKLVDRTLKYFIDFVQKHLDDKEKPIIYYSNSTLKSKKTIQEFNRFSDFVENLRIYSSWSTGMGIWKEDFDKLRNNNNFNELFPHTTILFNERKREKYIIDDSFLLDEMPQGKKPKGNYDLFYAFAVEYPTILLDLVKEKDLTVEAFLNLKKEILNFCSVLAVDYFVFRKYCSYDLSSFDKSMNVFFCKKTFLFNMFIYAVTKISTQILKVMKINRG